MLESKDLLFDKIPMPILIIDKNGQIEDVNSYSLIFFEANTKEELQNHFNNYFSVLNGNDHGEFQMTLQTLQNKKREVSISLTPLEDKKDQGVMIITDISKYNELIEENKLLAKLPEANPDMVIIIDLDLNVKYLNPKGNLKLNEIKKKYGNCGVLDLLPKEISLDINESFSKRIEVIKNYKLRDSRYLMKIKPFEGEDICMVTLSDISDVMKLREEIEILAEAFEKNNQPMIITDKESNIVRVNQALEKLYGYDEQELMGEKINKINPGRDVYKELGYTDEDYDHLFSSLWEDLLDPAIGKWDDVVINKSKEGKLIWARLLITAIYDEDKNLNYFIGMPVDISKNIDEVASTKVGLYQAIADLAEMRDYETGNHMKRIGLYSRLLAEELGMPKKYCEDIEIFAPLHDIGKVGISDLILLAERKLSEEEFEVIKNHSMFGYQILKDKEEISMAAEITLNHHEKYDGKGYPGGKKADEIPLSARIVAIADVYDALRSKRPYKPAWTHEEAIKEIFSLSGLHFDPRLIQAFKVLENKFNSICENLKD